MRRCWMAMLVMLCAVAAVAICSTPASAQISGAIFTTDTEGTVDRNLYENKCDVYLNGGPRKDGSAGLPPGEYYVKVTEPNGTLLGTSVDPRLPADDQTPVTVLETGKFEFAYPLCDIVVKASNLGKNKVCFGYDTTSNNGGEYKVWISQDPDFPNSQSKTDNFKVKTKGPMPPEQTEISAWKFYDRNANGTWDEGEPPIPNWHVELRLKSDNSPVGCGLTDGGGEVQFLVQKDGTEYVVVETLVEPYVNSTPLSFEVTADAPIREVFFGNFCVVTVDFDTKGYWHNKNGLGELEDADRDAVNGLAPYSAASSYFGAGDEPFDGQFADGTPVAAAKGESGEEVAPAGSWKAEVSQFLVDANAGGDPREQLAQQLLAFIFNTRHRLGCSEVAVWLPEEVWISASQLIDEAIAAWESDDAVEQDMYKNLLDVLNNSNELSAVACEPCPFEPVPCP